MKVGELAMEKIKCIKCGSIGYTAAPESVICSSCGGTHEVIEMDEDDRKMKSITSNQYLQSLTFGKRGN